MSKHSIMVALNGSEQSRHAAELAWFLAQKLDATVTAEHVIDTRSTWEILRSDTPGFIGSGPYVLAYDQLVQSLRSLSDKLCTKYEAMADGAGVKGSVEVKEGNPVSILAKDGLEHNLVVLGHVPSGTRAIERERSHYVRHSIAAGVAHECSVPVLIVQSKPTNWEVMSIVSEIDHINVSYIRSCLKLALLLGLRPRLEFWGTGKREEKPADFKKNITEEIPELKGMEIDVEYFGGDSATDRKSFITSEGRENETAECLFVLPTRAIANRRITVLDMEPDEFIHSLTLPCLLLWPEDHTGFDLKESKKTDLMRTK